MAKKDRGILWDFLSVFSVIAQNNEIKIGKHKKTVLNIIITILNKDKKKHTTETHYYTIFFTFCPFFYLLDECLYVLLKLFYTLNGDCINESLFLSVLIVGFFTTSFIQLFYENTKQIFFAFAEAMQPEKCCKKHIRV